MEMYNERMVLDLIILIWWENCSYQNLRSVVGTQS